MIFKLDGGELAITDTRLTFSPYAGEQPVDEALPAEVSFTRGAGEGDGSLIVNGHTIRVPNDQAFEVLAEIRRSESDAATSE